MKKVSENSKKPNDFQVNTPIINGRTLEIKGPNSQIEFASPNLSSPKRRDFKERVINPMNCKPSNKSLFGTEKLYPVEEEKSATKNEKIVEPTKKKVSDVKKNLGI